MQTSAFASARLLRKLRDDFGDLGLAAAAYNAGSGRVQKWLARQSELPRETREGTGGLSWPAARASGSHSCPGQARPVQLGTARPAIAAAKAKSTTGRAVRVASRARSSRGRVTTLHRRECGPTAFPFNKPDALVYVAARFQIGLPAIHFQ